MGAQRGDAKSESIGRSAGGLSTKIHALVDGLGNPIGFHLTPVNASGLAGADVPLQKLKAKAVIPPRRHRKQRRECDRELYKARHLGENFFGKWKQYRGIATRYDKGARNFLGAIHLATTVMWLI